MNDLCTPEGLPELVDLAASGRRDRGMDGCFGITWTNVAHRALELIAWVLSEFGRSLPSADLDRIMTLRAVGVNWIHGGDGPSPTGEGLSNCGIFEFDTSRLRRAAWELLKQDRRSSAAIVSVPRDSTLPSIPGVAPSPVNAYSVSRTVSQLRPIPHPTPPVSPDPEPLASPSEPPAVRLASRGDADSEPLASRGDAGPEPFASRGEDDAVPSFSGGNTWAAVPAPAALPSLADLACVTEPGAKASAQDTTSWPLRPAPIVEPPTVVPAPASEPDVAKVTARRTSLGEAGSLASEGERESTPPRIARLTPPLSALKSSSPPSSWRSSPPPPLVKSSPPPPSRKSSPPPPSVKSSPPPPSRKSSPPPPSVKSSPPPPPSLRSSPPPPSVEVAFGNRWESPRARLERPTSVTGGDESLNALIEQNQDAIRRYPVAVKPYRALYQLYGRKRNHDGAFCASQVLSYLGMANEAEQRFFDTHRPKGLLRVTGKLDSVLWSQNVVHPTEDGDLSRMMEILADSASRYRVHLQQQGLASDALLAAPVPCDQRTDTVLVRMFDWASAVFGIGRPKLLVRDDESASLNMLPTEEPTSVAGRFALTGMHPRELTFVVGKHLSGYRNPYRAWNLLADVDALRALLIGAMHGAEPAASRDLVRAMASDCSDGKQDAVSVARFLRESHLRRLAPILRSYVHAGRFPDLGRWLRAVELTMCRAGLLLSGDLCAASKVLHHASGSGLDQGTIPEQDRIEDLLVFSVSPEYFEIRRALGVSLELGT